MKLQLTLALICVLLPKALTLVCNQCIADPTGKCTDTQVVCPNQCGSATLLLNAAGLEQTVRTKDCAAAAECVSGSMNLGVMKMTMKTECCTTDLCNRQFPAVLAFGSPNGKKCYTCTDNECRATVSCEGDEDRCISATELDGTTATLVGFVLFKNKQLLVRGWVGRSGQFKNKRPLSAVATSGNTQVTAKGCESRSLRTADSSSMKAAGVTGSVSCCEGDLCNSAEGVKLSLLIMVAPLISSTLFH